MKLSPSVIIKAGPKFKSVELLSQQGMDELGPEELEEMITKLVKVRQIIHDGDPQEELKPWFNYWKAISILEKRDEPPNLTLVPCSYCDTLIGEERPFKLRIKENEGGMPIGYHYFCSEGCIHGWTM